VVTLRYRPSGLRGGSAAAAIALLALAALAWPRRGPKPLSAGEPVTS
jgi:hypothetical protein